MTGTRWNTRPARRWVLPIAASLAAVTTLAVAVAVAQAIRSAPRQPAAGSATRQPSSQPTGPAPAPTAVADPAAVLERLAQEVADGPADPARSRFEYVDIRVWESFVPPATESAPAAASSSGSPPVGPARRIQLWTTGQGAGRAVVIDEQRGCPPESDQTLHDLGPFDGPLSSDPDAVRRQILHEPLPPDASPDVFGQVGFFYSSRFVPLATRQGVLRMLARQPGIGVQLGVTDRIGRTGIAVSWTYRPPMPFTVAKTLLFDPRTGRLLASHSRTIPTSTTAPPDPGAHYEGYTLYLTTTYTEDTATPPIGCPA